MWPIRRSRRKAFPDCCRVRADPGATTSVPRKFSTSSSAGTRGTMSTGAKPRRRRSAAILELRFIRALSTELWLGAKKTGDQTPNGLTSCLGGGRYQLEQYEALRREALREDWRERGHGMALFISRGMPSWVAAVAALAPAARQPQQRAAEEAPHPQRPVVALSFRAELTAVL